jgi:cholecystokinin A receptor/hypocretin (orexin) receptor 2
LNWQVSLKAAKVMCLASVGVGLGCSWISAIMYDIQKGKHKVYNVTIFQCIVTDDMKETLFPLINNFMFATIFVGVFTVTFSFYSCIAVRIRRQMRWKHSYQGRFGIENTQMKIFGEMSTEQTGETLTDLNGSPDKMCKDTNVKAKKSKANKNHLYQTSKIMFMVSLAAIVSFTPVISILLIRSLDKKFVESLDNTEKAVCNFFLRSYFINNAVNPLIYGILDVKFRSSCKKLCFCGRT